MSPARWNRCWQAAKAAGDPGPCHAWLAAAYAEPHRHYHTAQHIAEGFQILDAAGPQVGPPLAVELAWWFHDVVYDPKAHDNEERSAAQVRQWLTEAGVETSLVEKVNRLILATKHHDPALEDDAPIIVDVDLSIFGQPTVRFQEYENQIRQEYAWVPAAVFAVKRAEVLETFLARPRIYHTDWFFTRYEIQARANLQKALTQLRSSNLQI
jgi:predicted metal-dependent HD superfamily phosphohydrolase